MFVFCTIRIVDNPRESIVNMPEAIRGMLSVLVPNILPDASSTAKHSNNTGLYVYNV